MNLFDDIKAIQTLDAITDSRRVPYGIKPICNGKNTIKFKVKHDIASKLMNKIGDLDLNVVSHAQYVTVYGVIASEKINILKGYYQTCKANTQVEKIKAKWLIGDL